MKNFACLALTLSFFLSGCHFPKRTPQLDADLVWLDQHGHSRDEVELPHRAWLACLLDIFPPGCGHYYIGHIREGVLTTIFSFTVVPWIIGPIHAYKVATFENDLAYVDYAHENGWFEQRDLEVKTGSPAPAARAPAAEAPAPAPVSPATERPPTMQQPAAESHFCAGCGRRLPDDATFCPDCGRKR